MVATIFYATQGTITVNSVNCGAGSGYTAQVKEIRVRGMERGVDSQACFGSGINVHMYEKQPTLCETEITLIKKDVTMEQRAMMGSPYDTTGSISATWGVRDYQTIVYDWKDSHDLSGAQLKLTFGSVLCTKVPELSISADGYLEETVSFACLPSMYKPEYTSDRKTNALA